MKPDTKIRPYKKEPTVNNITVQVDTKQIESLLRTIMFMLLMLQLTIVFK